MCENSKIKIFDNPSHYADLFNKPDEKYFNYLTLNNINKENQSKKEFLNNNLIINSPNYEDITVIIPFRDANDPKRIENLKTVINHLKIIGVENLIISEEDDFSKLTDFTDDWNVMFKNFLLLFTESNDLFNKSVAINEGVKRANTSNVVMMDSDVLIQKEVFSKSISLLNSFFDFVYPFNRMVKQIYSIGESLENFNFNEVNSELEMRPNADGGCLFCRKRSLLNIGGFNQAYKGWGGEDNEITLRINLSNYKSIRLNNILYHLHHTKKRLNGSNADILVKATNLSRFNDINILINENREMYLNSILFQHDFFKPITNNYLISIIIPVCNCDFFYLDRCITSLKNQTLGFENIEVILVDMDCNDESINLINKYVEKFDNVKSIFLDENSTINVARNEGIKFAAANYVTFLDSDDYLVKDICEITYNNLKEENADIIITNYINLENISSTNWESLINLNNSKYIKDYNEFMDIFLIPPSIGTKTYKKEFLLKENLFFKNYCGGEDLLFNQETLFKASGIFLIDTPAIIYSYNRNENKEWMSMNLDYDKDTLISLIDALEESYNLFNINAPNFTHIPLNNLNLFFNKILFKSKLSFDEFVEICDEIRLIVTNYFYNDNVHKTQSYLNFIELILNGKLTNAYESYLKFI